LLVKQNAQIVPPENGSALQLATQEGNTQGARTLLQITRSLQN
jgi:hypothetical protein